MYRVFLLLERRCSTIIILATKYSPAAGAISHGQPLNPFILPNLAARYLQKPGNPVYSSPSQQARSSAG